ncbi:hypothetical protein [Natronococcus wangiae]|uniref:hypothetical protein n=1 Tax=Natronococcus wangiae TaxID=3068275 RepID=UPI0027402563|nr:hypothetical protein [Natronococcus sp. AD5]
MGGGADLCHKGIWKSSFDTPYPVVISLHWAQRTIDEDEWVPEIQAAIAELVESPK